MNYYHVQDTEIMVRRNEMEKRIFRRGTAERAGESMEILRNRLKEHISNWLENTDTDTINGRRTEILNNCIKEGKVK